MLSTVFFLVIRQPVISTDDLLNGTPEFFVIDS